MRKRKITRIPNEGARKTTFFKRKQGIMKKLYELSTLCGIQACGVIFSPFQSEPEFWPSKSGAEEVVSRFMKMPTTSQNKKMLNQATYLHEMIIKTQRKTEKMAAECRDLEVREMMSNCFEGKMPEYGDGKNHLNLVLHIDKLYEKVIRRRLELSGESSSSCFPGDFAGASSIPTGGFTDLASGSGGFAGESFTPTVGFLALVSGSGGFGGANAGGGAGGFGELGQISIGFGGLAPPSIGDFTSQSCGGDFGSLAGQSSGGGGFGDQSSSGGFGGQSTRSVGFGDQSSGSSFGGFGGQSNGGGGGGCSSFEGNTGNPSEFFTQMGAVDAVASGLYDQNMNQNEQELVQYEAPTILYDNNQNGNNTFMNGSNYYNFQQLRSADLAITSHLPSFSVYAPAIDNIL